MQGFNFHRHFGKKGLIWIIKWFCVLGIIHSAVLLQSSNAFPWKKMEIGPEIGWRKCHSLILPLLYDLTLVLAKELDKNCHI